MVVRGIGQLVDFVATRVIQHVTVTCIHMFRLDVYMDTCDILYMYVGLEK